MDPDWSLAAVQQARAFHFGEYVSIHIAGDLPLPCHVVDIERNLLTSSVLGWNKQSRTARNGLA
jgi:hypothetical protein